MTTSLVKLDRAEVLAELSQWPHELQYVAPLGPSYTDETRTPADVDDANVYTSKITAAAPMPDGLHTLVLDIDVPARLVPSSTPGHSHLFIDAPMSFVRVERLLKLLAECGVIEDGYAAASIERGHTAVRLPWIRKDSAAPVE